MSTHFIVVDKNAKMPGSCWGKYRRVGVVEVATDVLPEDVYMLSDRSKQVIRIVATWEKLNVGKTPRCAYQVALAEAEALADEMNEVSR